MSPDPPGPLIINFACKRVARARLAWTNVPYGGGGGGGGEGRRVEYL